jgi:protein-S-isoprenylcysteine O-methyltransferase Ste14
MVRASATIGARVVALAGGLFFIFSLVYFVWSYTVRFDTPATGTSPWRPAALDTLLFSVFALHHSVFARAGVKSWIVRTVPATLERSTYVWISSALLVAVCAGWQAVPGTIWTVEGAARGVMTIAQALAAAATLIAARRLDVLDLAGVRQAFESGGARPGLDDTGPYGLVRHPIYLAWIAFVFLAPAMNGTRLVFAVVSSAYLLIAVPFEERDLHRSFGDAYAAYTRKVRWRVLPFVY